MVKIVSGMNVITDIHQISKETNSVVTIGTFDGVHTGHRKILETVAERSRVLGARSVLITFNPHPRMVITAGHPVPMLTTMDEKIAILKEFGLDILYFIPFTWEFAALTAEQFIREYLIDRIGVREVIVGYDHRFGKGRDGDEKKLRELGSSYGFGTDIIPAVSIDGTLVNSTAIRKQIEKGAVETASKMLGRFYSFTGIVHSGSQRGRQLGFPTANITVECREKLLPANGVYAIRAEINGEALTGVMNIGYRPTFNDVQERVIEVHLFGFEKDIYNATITVATVARIRAEKRFNSKEELIAQIQQDVETAKAILK